jgi:putative nucleotidyltransferase with HDIG domain
MLLPVETRARETIETLFSYIQAQGYRGYGGEAVSQLEHSLQAGHLARKAGADDETILAALLHDIGHFIPMYAEMPMLIAPNGSKVGRKSHDQFGEKYLRELGFSDKICQLVGAHVMAKRYLTAVDKEYYDTLSEVSKNSLRLQVSGCLSPLGGLTL